MTQCSLVYIIFFSHNIHLCRKIYCILFQKKYGILEAICSVRLLMLVHMNRKMVCLSTIILVVFPCLVVC
jgi:hypothetical protein